MSIVRRLFMTCCGVALVLLLAPATEPPIPAGSAALPAATPAPPDLPNRRSVTSACGTDNPYFVAACSIEYGSQISMRESPDFPSIVIFRNTPDDDPVLMAASFAQVGSVYGLGYSAPEHALFAAAFHKRMFEYGPGGSGTVYRIDLDTREATEFARLPAGPDRHSGLVDRDVMGRDFAAKTSLGDLDIGDDGEGLFVTNLEDGRIYRFDETSGALLSDFAHGAAAAEWAEDARPFALKVKDGHVYHGVVRSAEGSQDPFQLFAVVFQSRPDGSDMQIVAQVPLSGARGEARLPSLVTWPEPVVIALLDWLPWRDGYHTLVRDKATMAVYPQPIVTDIEFDGAGNMLLGLRDRMADMSLGSQLIGPAGSGVIEKPGLPAGDLIRLEPDGSGGWGGTPDDFYYDRTSLSDETIAGGLAVEPIADRVVAGAYALLPGDSVGSLSGIDEVALWYDTGIGRPVAIENVCDPLYFEKGDLSPHPFPPWTPRPGPSPTPRPTWTPVSGSVAEAAPLTHSEWLPARSIGDIERLCAPTPIPTATFTPGPTSTPTDTSTPTKTPEPTSTSLPSATPQPVVIYLPLAERGQCRRRRIQTDVVLVLDVSTSMRRDTRAGRSKLEAALEAATSFVDAMTLDPGAEEATDRVAIVGFNDLAWSAHPLSADGDSLRRAIAALAERSAEGTRLDLAFAAGIDALGSGTGDKERDRALLLLTDGLPNRVPTPEGGGSQEDTVLDVAARARDGGIVVYTIGLGLPGDFSRELLIEAAGDASRFHAAPDAEDLADIYRTLAGRLTACR